MVLEEGKEVRSKQLHSGFTLLEVVLVIAILSLLAAIILAVIGPARKMARVATCTSNLRQIGLAYEMYRADYGQYPRPRILTTSPYLNDKRILFCPEDTSIALLGAASSYHMRIVAPPHFVPLWEVGDLSPNTVLVYCDHHLGQSVIYLKNDNTRLTPPQYPYHLVLRASGAVQRIHVSRIRKFLLPGNSPMFMNAYPDEPGYEQAAAGR